MDLCLDLGCIEKQVSQSSVDSDVNPNDSLPSTSKPSKNKASKEGNPSSPHPLSRMIKKPTRRRTSPLNWFPRKKVDSYLKRKLKLLQEVDGMNLTLDETLHDTNPHFSKVLKEKIAVKEAAQKAIEARKSALIEASWCRILKAARIESKEAEEILVKAEKSATDAFESAKEIGVIMYDIQDHPRKHYKIETLNGNTHTVTTSFHTAFEVDKQVAAAVKAAFVKLSTCDKSIGKQEFKEILKKISQNPDLDEKYQDLCESETGSDLESKTHNIPIGKQEILIKSGQNPDSDEKFEDLCESKTGSDLESKTHNIPIGKQEILKISGQNPDSDEKFKDLCESELGFDLESKSHKIPERENLVDMMLERLRCSNEENLASLATIVATCGLNAALKEAENGGSVSLKEEIPSLDKFLVKRLTRLEKDIQDARNARAKEMSDKDNKISKEAEVAVGVPGLGSVLTKHTSKLEKEIEEIKRKHENEYAPKVKKNERVKQDLVPGLGDVLVKRVSRLEREVQEAKKEKEKENVDFNKEKRSTKVGLVTDVGSLDSVLVKHVSRLEKEKLAFGENKEEEVGMMKRKDVIKSDLGSLDQVLVKHKSRIEREKVGTAVADVAVENEIKNPIIARREAREREMQEAWGGMSFGNSIRPTVSRLQREKAAWLKAEEEEKRVGGMEETKVV